jgi:alkyl hydroperoxide reductase subunit AhpC
MLTVGDKFPEFRLQAVVSTEAGKEFREISHAAHPGKWKVVFLWPMDFTFVCPTEIAEFGRRNPDFVDRDAQVLGASTDTHFVHLAWRRDHADLKNLVVEFPKPTDWNVKFEVDLKDRTGKVTHYLADGKLDQIGYDQRTLSGTWMAGTTKGDFKLTRDRDYSR